MVNGLSRIRVHKYRNLRILGICLRFSSRGFRQEHVAVRIVGRVDPVVDPHLQVILSALARRRSDIAPVSGGPGSANLDFCAVSREIVAGSVRHIAFQVRPLDVLKSCSGNICAPIHQIGQIRRFYCQICRLAIYGKDIVGIFSQPAVLHRRFYRKAHSAVGDSCPQGYNLVIKHKPRFLALQIGRIRKSASCASAPGHAGERHAADPVISDGASAYPALIREIISALCVAGAVRRPVADIYRNHCGARKPQRVYCVPEIVCILILVGIIDISHSVVLVPAKPVLIVHDLRILDPLRIHRNGKQVIVCPVDRPVHQRERLMHWRHIRFYVSVLQNILGLGLDRHVFCSGQASDILRITLHPILQCRQHRIFGVLAEGVNHLKDNRHGLSSGRLVASARPRYRASL